MITSRMIPLGHHYIFSQEERGIWDNTKNKTQKHVLNDRSESNEK